MFLPELLNSSMLQKYTNELLEINQKTKEHGLVLTPDEVKNMLVVRNQVLRGYGRIELGIEVTKQLAEVFSGSPYINNENYASTLNELHEIFYDLKNETEEKISDFKLIERMKDDYDNVCGGSVELLKSKLDEFAEHFRSDMQINESELERDEC